MNTIAIKNESAYPVLNVNTKFGLGHILIDPANKAMGIVTRISVQQNAKEIEVGYFIEGNGRTFYVKETDARRMVLEPDLSDSASIEGL